MKRGSSGGALQAGWLDDCPSLDPATLHRPLPAPNLRPSDCCEQNKVWPSCGPTNHHPLPPRISHNLLPSVSMPPAPRTPGWIKDSPSDQLDSFFKPVDSLSPGSWHAALSSHRYRTPHMIQVRPGAPRMDLRFVFAMFRSAGICLRHPTANRDHRQ